MILAYCLNCRTNTERKSPEVSKAKNGKIMLFSRCAVCGKTKSKFINEQEASHWVVEPIRNQNSFEQDTLLLIDICTKCIKMNNIISKFLITRDKFMPDLNLR